MKNSLKLLGSAQFHILWLKMTGRDCKIFVDPHYCVRAGFSVSYRCKSTNLLLEIDICI